MSKRFARIRLDLLLNSVVGALFVLAAIMLVLLVQRQARRQALKEAELKDLLVWITRRTG